MSFTDTPFFILVPIVWVLWYFTRHQPRARASVLLTGSLVFYGYYQRWLLLLLLTYCVLNWLIALGIERTTWRRTLLTGGVTFNLAVLAFWKYTPLVLRTLVNLDAGLIGRDRLIGLENWAIPFGISFYAFTGIAYMVDVYRGTTPAEQSFWRYTLSAVFFPHLVAGPILRPHEFLTRLAPGQLPARVENPLEAVTLLARGYFKKVVIADRLAIAIDPFFQHVGDPTTTGVCSLPYVYLYALQIYFDFSGYTDIARGLGLLFGFRWPENFDAPYLASSVQDFWRRWHMTLSRFLKDYLYIPLGGNRGNSWRTLLNLMLTMLLGGLWHGANWTFLLWGGLHGTFLVVNWLWARTTWSETLRHTGGLAWRMLCLVLTFHCVCFAWCFFRLTDLSQALACVRQWVVFDADKALVGAARDPSLWLLLAAYAVGVCAAWRWREWAREREERRWAWAGEGFRWGFGLTLLLLAAVLSPGGEKPPFIYFQF